MKKFIIKYKTDGSIIDTLNTKKQASDIVMKLVELNKLDNVFDVVCEEQDIDDYPHTFGKEIDWKQRRYEIAKDILTAWCSNSDRGTGLGIPKNDSAAAVRYADALIKALKEK